MKAIFSLIGILFITNINAQKFDCTSKMTAYQDFFKAKDIAAAFDTWSEVKKNCPKQSESVYTDGFNIIQYKIDNAATAEEKETLVRDKMALYDQYNKNFPEKTADYEVNKAMALHDNKIEAKEEIFSLLDSGFSKASASITNANAIYTYFSLCYEKYKAGDKKFTADLVLDKYTLVNYMLTQLQNSQTEKTDQYKTAQRGINALSKDLVNCSNLASYYEKNFTQNKDNNDWIATALTNLSAKCSSQPVFVTMAEKLYSVKATSQSAYFMALANLRQRKFTEAIQFYNQAADLETNPQEKAKIYYTLATGLLANDMTKSKETLNKALQFDPKMGRAHLFLAQLYSYAPEECGKDDFEKKAIYYLAIETAKKAGIADPKLKPAADKMAQDFASKALTQAEINKAKMNGKSLTIDCWINETITFPAK
ncbi:hypothetical protein IVB69_10155 [Flavobacterium sp. J49]|uniref:hypothetical protein n=1 Tax=Flavobacterium sp. J49 TaxID=2718534 RepID=UPI0015937E96|nr:hypothetical protein [Flavobacterium sp. J49]MBF6641841.1 hypothetical protein [Flavobacterium sp. J49]NIC03088.1 hypothetical protein [Flavobacterium sp. J49]